MSEQNTAEQAVTIEGLSKDFILPHERNQSVKQAFTGLLRRHNRSIEMQHALQDINFSIKKGEFFGIVGRNGSGKSTLLKLLAGIYQPTKGSVEVRGKLVPFIELGVGFNPELTGRENVHLNCALLGFAPTKVRKMYDDIVEFAELERFMDQKLKNYSSGMQVRLAFSVAIMAEAEILLIDEVLAVGDADFQRKCFEYFKSLKKRKKTVVFVTHDMNAVREYCDRAILIDRSKLITEGSADEIAEQYVRLFVPGEGENAEKPAKQGGRWGDGSASIVAVKPEKTLVEADDRDFTIEVTIKANKDIEDPVAGFLIKDSADRPLFGTNTRIKRQRLGSLRRGEKRTLRWTVPNIFADGKHFIDATVEHNDGVSVCDWWTEAAAFAVHKSERTAYAITPPIRLSVVTKENKGKTTR